MTEERPLLELVLREGSIARQMLDAARERGRTVILRDVLGPTIKSRVDGVLKQIGRR